MNANDNGNVTVDGDKLVEAIGVDSARKILDVMDLTLSQVRWNQDGLLSISREWHESTEGRWWQIEMRQLPISDSYSVRWTVTDEAGIDDVTIVERMTTTDDDVAAMTDCLVALCRALGDGRVR